MPKRKYTRNNIPLDIMQQHMAASMSRIIHNMVNKNLQQHCLELLSAENVQEVEMRILFVLKEIDNDLEQEGKDKKKPQKRKK